MKPALKLILPDWPAPANVLAAVSTRSGGVSQGPWASLNLGDHVGDDPQAVAENRRLVTQACGLAAAPHWLRQVHGTAVHRIEGPAITVPEADAICTTEPEQACVVMTADCLPVLFCSDDGAWVAAAHAGWRGLCDGVLEATVQSAERPAERLMAWLGPAIGPAAFEVGDEVRAAFMARAAEDAAHFAPHDPGKWRADLYALARARLRRAGLTAIYGGDYCTVTDATRFFSHRRDAAKLGSSGRFVSLVWRAAVQ